MKESKNNFNHNLGDTSEEGTLAEASRVRTALASTYFVAPSVGIGALVRTVHAYSIYKLREARLSNA